MLTKGVETFQRKEKKKKEENNNKNNRKVRDKGKIG